MGYKWCSTQSLFTVKSVVIRPDFSVHFDRFLTDPHAWSHSSSYTITTQSRCCGCYLIVQGQTIMSRLSGPFYVYQYARISAASLPSTIVSLSAMQEPTIDYSLQRLSKMVPKHVDDPDRLSKVNFISVALFFTRPIRSNRLGNDSETNGRSSGAMLHHVGQSASLRLTDAAKRSREWIEYAFDWCDVLFVDDHLPLLSAYYMSSLEGIIRGEWREGICYFACPVIWFGWFFFFIFSPREFRSTRNDFLFFAWASRPVVKENIHPFEQNRKRTADSHWSISHRFDLLLFQVTREIQPHKCRLAVTVPTATLTVHPPRPMQLHRLIFSTVRLWAVWTSFQLVFVDRCLSFHLIEWASRIISFRNDESHVIGIYKYRPIRAFTFNVIGTERIERHFILRAKSNDDDEIKNPSTFLSFFLLFSLVQFDIIIIIIFIFLFHRLSLPSCVDVCVCVFGFNYSKNATSSSLCCSLLKKVLYKWASVPTTSELSLCMLCSIFNH